MYFQQFLCSETIHTHKKNWIETVLTVFVGTCSWPKTTFLVTFLELFLVNFQHNTWELQTGNKKSFECNWTGVWDKLQLLFCLWLNQSNSWRLNKCDMKPPQTQFASSCCEVFDMSRKWQESGCLRSTLSYILRIKHWWMTRARYFFDTKLLNSFNSNTKLDACVQWFFFLSLLVCWQPFHNVISQLVWFFLIGPLRNHSPVRFELVRLKSFFFFLQKIEPRHSQYEWHSCENIDLRMFLRHTNSLSLSAEKMLRVVMYNWASPCSSFCPHKLVIQMLSSMIEVKEGPQSSGQIQNCSRICWNRDIFQPNLFGFLMNGGTAPKWPNTKSYLTCDSCLLDSSNNESSGLPSKMRPLFQYFTHTNKFVVWLSSSNILACTNLLCELQFHIA